MVSAKQKANWARFAAMSRARARALKGKGKPTKERRLKNMSGKGKGKGKKNKARGAPKRDMAMPAGFVAGGTYAATNALVDGQAITILTKWKDLSVPDRVLRAMQSTAKQLGNKKVYAPALIGLGISVAPKIPALRIVARPVDRLVRRVSKGKVSM